jgi:hypothetical protein
MLSWCFSSFFFSFLKYVHALQMVESPVVLVKGGRHPLQQLVVDTFIPNDIALGVNEKSAAVITGPNFSGNDQHMFYLSKCRQFSIIFFECL